MGNRIYWVLGIVLWGALLRPDSAMGRCTPLHAAESGACRHRIQLAGGAEHSPSFTPYYASDDLDEPNHEVTRAIIVVHGILLDADDYFTSIVQAARAAGRLNETLVIAPKFQEADSHPGADEPFWDQRSDGHDWKRGDESFPVPATGLSIASYAVVDQMVQRLEDRARFPRLESIVVAGHSGGGQFTGRYALGNEVDDGSLPVPVHYVVANPSSYLYLDGRRPEAGTTDRFAIPSAPDCADYDDYTYGMQRRNDYMGRATVAEIAASFTRRNVTLLIGGSDTLSEDLDQSCEAMLEGPNRRERGKAYATYLATYYPSPRHRLQLVPGVGHDHVLMFTSREGIAVLFGK